MKKLVILPLLLLFCVSVGQVLYFVKDGFSPRRIQSLAHFANEEWNEEVKAALKQTFRYLGRGRQCFAFASADGKYVLKFPRTDIYKTPLWVKSLPVSTYRKNLEADHKEREEFILDSLRISFQELKEQTGLLAIHLGQSESRQFLKVIDASGYLHSLPLGKTSFVLQTKHPILMRTFSEALNRKDLREAKKILDALLHAILERARKGILNRDRSFLRNYGFDGTSAYQIDVGSFFKRADLSQKAAFEKSARDSLDPIQEWLAQNAPELLDYFNNQIKENLL